MLWRNLRIVWTVPASCIARDTAAAAPEKGSILSKTIHTRQQPVEQIVKEKRNRRTCPSGRNEALLRSSFARLRSNTYVSLSALDAWHCMYLSHLHLHNSYKPVVNSSINTISRHRSRATLGCKKLQEKPNKAREASRRRELLRSTASTRTRGIATI